MAFLRIPRRVSADRLIPICLSQIVVAGEQRKIAAVRRRLMSERAG